MQPIRTGSQIIARVNIFPTKPEALYQKLSQKAKRLHTLGMTYEQIAKMHNELGITEPLKTQVSPFHNRPFMIIQADDFADAIHAKIEIDEVKRLPKYLGGIDQYVDSTDVLSYTEKFRRFWSMYQ